MTSQQMQKRLGFKEAQALFSTYYTLKPNHVLRDELTQILPEIHVNDVNVREFYNQAIVSNYPNETSIKAAFLNNVLFKSKKDITIFELPVGKSRVDLCKVNGTSIAYEIKTDIDTLKRLDKQISDYARVFEQVYVICSEDRLSDIESVLPEQYGIYTYAFSSKKQCRFTLHRAATENFVLNSEYQVSLLLKAELVRYFGLTQITSITEAVDYILDHFTSGEINEVFKSALKDRFRNKWRFLESNHKDIFEIDYQWFFQNHISPRLIYGT